MSSEACADSSATNIPVTLGGVGGHRSEGPAHSHVGDPEASRRLAADVAWRRERLAQKRSELASARPDLEGAASHADGETTLSEASDACRDAEGVSGEPDGPEPPDEWGSASLAGLRRTRDRARSARQHAANARRAAASARRRAQATRGDLSSTDGGDAEGAVGDDADVPGVASQAWGAERAAAVG